MAIAFARARYISRSDGGSAVRSAAYNSREAIRAEKTGSLYYFAHRDKPEHHEVLLPDGASAMLAEASTLWNAAEMAERRKDAQLAREIVLALPANAEVTVEDRIELARRFALENFVAKGLAVQLDVHAPHTGDTESERANWHAHLLITTRRVEGEGFSVKKARDLEPAIRSVRGRAVVSEGEAWGEVWRDLQNRFFAENGLDIRVETTGPVAQSHIGPIRMRAADAEANARADETARANAKAVRDPEAVLSVVTRNNATFTERDVERHVGKHVADPVELAAVKEKVFSRSDVTALFDRESGEAAGRFTTKGVREQEVAALADAAEVAGQRGVRVAEPAKVEALSGRALRADQFDAYKHAVADGGLKIIEGRAGTGKSFTLAAIRDAHTKSGHEVIGLAPTNAAAQDMRTDGFARANTVHSELFRIKNGLTSWGRGSVVIADEAAMLDSRITGELMSEAKRAGAKLILAGDDRQLASIERGGLFTELKNRHGSVAITEVTRQKVDWQRQAARDLSEGRFEEALRAFARERAITWTQRPDQARAALVERWKADTASKPDASRFVFAYTNKEVDALNVALRSVRRERGDLGTDHSFETKHGVAAFAVGDRVQFTDTLKSARIYNGNAGTITAIDGATGLIKARLDAPAGTEPREATWSVSEFSGFRHGYAGTIYKGQGKTIDQTYLLHTHHWRQASSYVALTRQRESAQLFVATEATRDVRELARQMGRGEVKAASVAYATFDELTPQQRARLEGRVEQPAAPTAAERPGKSEVWAAKAKHTGGGPEREDNAASAASAAVRAGVGGRPPADRSFSAAAVLIAPCVDPQGRDSLGRGLDAASVREVVAADGRVVQERRDQLTYLAGAYRAPAKAGERLADIVGRDGFMSAARRIETKPAVLGDLRGRTGLFASGKAKAERARASTVAGALADNVRRVGDAEAGAESSYRANVETQRQADAVAIHCLSERAEAALRSVSAAQGRDGQAAAFEAVRADANVARELQAFAAAVERRFGEDGVRAILRSLGQPGAYQAASVPREDQPRLDKVVKTIRTLKVGERMAEAVRSEREGLRQGRGMKM